MKKYFPLLSAIFFSLSGLCQQNEIVNFNTISGNMSFCFGDGVIDENGNHIVMVQHAGKRRLVMIDANYITLWEKDVAIGSTADPGKVIQLASGEYIAMVNSDDTEPYSGHLLRFDALGTVYWHKKFSISGAMHDLVQLPNGNIVVLAKQLAGSNFPMLFDQNGNFLNSKRIYGSSQFQFNCINITLTNDNGFVLASMLHNSPYYGILLSKFDQNLNLIWDKFYKDSIGKSNLGRMMIQASDNNFYMTGHYNRTGDLGDPFFRIDSNQLMIRKFDEYGNYINSKAYGRDFAEYGYALVEDHEGHFILTSDIRHSSTCGGNIMFMRFNSNLDTIYTRQYGKLVGTGIFFRNIHRKNNLYYSFGYGGLWSTIGTIDGNIIKTDAFFNFDCETYPQIIYEKFIDSLIPIPSVFSYTDFNLTMTDMDETDVSGTISEIGCIGYMLETHSDQSSSILVYPNPSSGIIEIDLGQSFPESTVLVSDIQGRETLRLQARNQQCLNLDLNKNRGIYFLHIFSDGTLISSKRIVIQ